MGTRVLILSASIGSGHVKAAQAIERAILDLDQNVEVKHEDALDFINPALRRLCQNTYRDLAHNAPEILGLLYGHAERVWSTQEHGVALERWNSLPLIKVITKYNPDIVVSTHPQPADMISWLICKKRLNTQNAVVVTDFELNPLWLCQHYSRYFVALQESKEHLVNIGYSRDKIIVSGIPIDPVFCKQKDKAILRKKFGIAQDRRTILISAGGIGTESVEELLRSLMQLDDDLHLLVCCGNDEELRVRVNAFSMDSKMMMRVFGYTNEIDELMTVADLILGKSGGLTVSEALSKGLPFVIVNPIPGQEERNADHLLEEGAALRCNSWGALSYKIGLLLHDPVRIEQMRQSALKMSRPRAAETVARELLLLAGSKEPGNVHPLDHRCDEFSLKSFIQH